MYIEPVKKVNLSEKISNRLLEQINLGHFKPGERLPSERELSEIFDASRTTIREAIKGLTSVGVIQKKRGGNYVCDDLSNIISKPFDILLSTAQLNMSEIIEARMSIESQLARLAAVRATDEELSQMEECVMANMENKNALMRKSIKFHELIATSAKNRVLSEMYSVIYRILCDNQKNEDSLRKVQSSQMQHRQIFEAIRERDPDRAEELMKSHLSVLGNET